MKGRKTMKQTYHLHVVENAAKIAKEAGIELMMPDTTEMTIEIPDKAIPDKTGIYLGKCVNGVYTSNIEKDDEDCTQLKKCIELGIIHTKVFTQLINHDLCEVPHYFFMYGVDESSVHTPTYTEYSCGLGTPINGHFECEYEVLLGTEEYTRRMVFKTSSVNISMYDWIQDLKDEIEDLDEAEDWVKEQFFKDKDEFGDETWKFTMFDDIGCQTGIEFNPDEFLSMIVSVRQLSCKFIDD